MWLRGCAGHSDTLAQGASDGVGWEVPGASRRRGPGSWPERREQGIRGREDVRADAEA